MLTIGCAEEERASAIHLFDFANESDQLVGHLGARHDCSVDEGVSLNCVLVECVCHYRMLLFYY